MYIITAVACSHHENSSSSCDCQCSHYCPAPPGMCDSHNTSSRDLPVSTVYELHALYYVQLPIILPISFYHLRKCHSRKTFSPEELYDASGMECLPLATEKQVMVLADVTTKDFLLPGDTIGQTVQDDKESGSWINFVLSIPIA